MIIFVGDKPSKDNIDPKIAFVGTKSYKTLLGWIADMNLSIEDVLLTNCMIREDDYVEIDRRSYLYYNHHKYVALGKASEKKLKKANLKYFSLPHPSGLNRKINDKKWLNVQLEECKKWLNE